MSVRQFVCARARIHRPPRRACYLLMPKGAGSIAVLGLQNQRMQTRKGAVFVRQRVGQSGQACLRWGSHGVAAKLRPRESASGASNECEIRLVRVKVAECSAHGTFDSRRFCPSTTPYQECRCPSRPALSGHARSTGASPPLCETSDAHVVMKGLVAWKTLNVSMRSPMGLLCQQSRTHSGVSDWDIELRLAYESVPERGHLTKSKALVCTPR